MLKESLQRALQIQNIKITPEQEQKFEMYYNLLVQWNEKMNLTAITEEVRWQSSILRTAWRF